MLSRRKLTDLLLTTIASQTSKPVHDYEPDSEQYGWSGTPGEAGSTFTPYSVLIPQSSGGANGPLSDTQSDWRITYSVSSFGTSREQAEWIADLARSSFSILRRTTFDGIDSAYTIQQVKTEQIGGIVRNSVVEPPIFGQTDIFAVWIAKGV